MSTLYKVHYIEILIDNLEFTFERTNQEYHDLYMYFNKELLPAVCRGGTQSENWCEGWFSSHTEMQEEGKSHPIVLEHKQSSLMLHLSVSDVKLLLKVQPVNIIESKEMCLQKWQCFSSGTVI